MKEIHKLNVGSLSLKRYADLDYDEWYALAEFVDNSLHSFLNNRAELEKIGINHCEVKISITEENKNEVINIVDDSGGIHPNDFDRLLTMGMAKEKSDTQLSEFGMGMKTASIWLGNLIEIESKHYLANSNKAYKITIDIDALGTDNEVRIEEVIASSNKRCYTKIKISKLNRRLSFKSKKIKESLSSIYRKFIERGDIVISILDEVLSPIPFELLEKADGSLTKKDFEIILSNGKKCKGWIGIMKKGKTVMSGFSIYRFGRLIQGYPENSWRPAEVFGQEGGSNTTKNQRLIGELDMTSFDAAHTKNKINFKGEEEKEFRKQLGDFCKDIAREADKKNSGLTTIKDYQDKPSTKITNEIVEEFLKKPINTDISSIQFIEPSIKEKTPEKISELIESGQYSFTVDLRNMPGIEKMVTVYEFMDLQLPYLISDEKDEDLIVCINVAHPFFQSLETPDKQITFKLTCIFDALSELNCKKRYGQYKPEDIRLTKDLFLKRYAENGAN
jgi:Histidine kinase-, DNA gyrase B-, and HSP90-like ATPase